MAFTLPTMNLAVNIWRDPGITLPIPPVTPPDVVTIGNLTPGRRVTNPTGNVGNEMYLLMPAATLIFDGSPGPTWGLDIVEVPAGSGRYYRCYFADNVASGFTNQHVLAVLQKARAFGSGNGYTPPPTPPPPPAPPPTFLATATTGGATANTLGITLVPPALQDCLVFVAVWNNSNAPSIPGFTIVPGGAPTFGTIPSCFLYALKGQLTAGSHPLTITLASGGIGAIQATAYGMPFVTATLDRYRTNTGSASNGALTDVAPGAHSNEYYFAAYATIGGTNNLPGITGLSSPGTPVVDTISAATCRLNFVPESVVAPTTVHSSCIQGPYTAWGCIQLSYF